MANIRYNSAPTSLFDPMVIGGGQASEREKLIAQGRLIMYEACGREKNRIRLSAGQSAMQFDSRLPADKDYRTVSENYKNKFILYCAKTARLLTNEPAPETFEDFKKYQRDYYSDKIFYRILSGVTKDIIRPLLPYVISAGLGELSEIVEIGFGETYEITVASNDVMIFSDSAWGASRSVPKQSLYNYPIVLNPELKSATAQIKWRQLVANDVDIGLWFNSLASGMYSKVMAMWSKTLIDAAGNAFFTPAYLQFASYNSANFITAAKKVSEVNHVDRKRLICFGDWLALSKVLPSGTTQDAALTYGLGSDWNSNGYLGTTLGVPCHILENVIVPGTQNTTGEEVLPSDKLFIAAARGNGTAPVYVGIERDTPIQLELEPTETADMSINVNLSISLDVKAVFGTKVAVISGV